MLTEVTSTQESVYMKTSLQIPGYTSLPSTYINSNWVTKKVYEDEIFGRQDILQFFSGEFKDYNYVKFPQTFGAP